MPVLQQTQEYGGTERPQVTTLLAIDGVGEAGVTSDFSPFGELRARIDADAAISTGISFDPTRATFSYDASGALIESVRFTDFNSAAPQFFENHLRTRYAYDGAGRIASLTHDFATGDSPTGGGQYTQYEQILGFGFGYDAANRIDGIDTAWNVTLPGLGGYDAARSDAHDYDDAGQLQQVDRTAGGSTATVGQYAYDDNGNRLARYEQGDADLYALANDQNRISSDSQRRYEYDAEGNLTAIYVTGSPDVLEQTLAYDHRNRLTRAQQYDATGQLAETIDYRYDASDNLASRRVEPVIGAATVEFYRSDAAGRRVLTLDAQKDVARRYAYGATGEVLFDQVFDGLGATSSQIDQHLPIGDHQHTTRAILDGADDAVDPLSVQQSYEYAEFGTITHVRDAAGNELLDGAGDPDLDAIDAAFLWHGSEHDAATGRSRMGARWYDPHLGRFLTEDPLGLADGPNPYRFAGNDPVNFADPTGTTQDGHPLSGGFSGGSLAGPPAVDHGFAGYQSSPSYFLNNPLGFSGSAGTHASSNSLAFAAPAVPRVPDPNTPSPAQQAREQAFLNWVQNDRLYDGAGSSYFGLGRGRDYIPTGDERARLEQRFARYAMEYARSDARGETSHQLSFFDAALNQSVLHGRQKWREFLDAEARRNTSRLGVIWDNHKLWDNAAIGQDAVNVLGDRTGGWAVAEATYAAWGNAVGGQTGLTGVVDGVEGLDHYGNRLSTGERVFRGALGGVQLVGTAAGLRAPVTYAGRGLAQGTRATYNVAAPALQNSVRYVGAGAYRAADTTIDWVKRLRFEIDTSTLSMNGLGGVRLRLAPKSVAPYQVGLYSDLQAISRVGDELALHHVGQAHALEQLIPGYNRASAPAIALPDALHRQIPNLRGTVTGTARDILARDIRNLRTFTNAPNTALKQVISLNKTLYPQAF